MTVACAQGEYHDFTGYICYSGTEALVKDASFDLGPASIIREHPDLRNDEDFLQPFVFFRSGTWLDGTMDKGFWMGGSWRKGVWNEGHWCAGEWWGGTWKNGYFDNGIWYDGVWENGSFGQKALWIGGTWKTGRWFDNDLHQLIYGERDGHYGCISC